MTTHPIAKAVYSSFADRYSEIAPTKPHNGLYERPASLALLGEVDGTEVLDAGCGPGICSEILARAGAKIVGVDVTPEMIDLAKRRCQGLPAVFRIGDLSAPLEDADESFGKVLCSLALDYVEDLRPVFAEFHRVTRPGGTLVFSMSHPMSDWMNEKIRGSGVYYEKARFGMHWIGFGEPHPFVEAYRRPLCDIMNALSEAGWHFDRLVEPQPLPEMKSAAPATYDRLSRSPEFLCLRGVRLG